MSVRKRIKDEVEETQHDLKQVKYRGEFFETTTGHIMQIKQSESPQLDTLVKKEKNT